TTAPPPTGSAEVRRPACDRRPQPGRGIRLCEHEGSEMAREPFGARLRSLRERAGLSPSELAEKVGTDENHISRWEQSLPEPEFAIVERLAFALGMPAVELLTGRPVTWQKPTIRLTCDNFPEHLSTDHPPSPVDRFPIP